MFVTSLVNYIHEYKMFLWIEKIFLKKRGNKATTKMKINLCITIFLRKIGQ